LEIIGGGTAMRVLLLAAGSDIHSVRWANQLAEHGNEVHLCYVANQKPAMDKFNNKICLHELKFPAPHGYYLNVLQLKRIISKIKPDILNAHYSSGYGTLGRLVGFTPYLLSVYGSDVYDFPYNKKTNMKIIRKNLKAATEIASTSNAMAIQTSYLVDIPVSKINITPFGVDVEKFSKKNIQKDDNKIIIGSIKKLSPKYGMKYGILAIDYLVKNLLDNQKNMELEYRIYGEGEEKEELELLVKECNLENIVKFMGRVPNEVVPEALNEMDIFLGNSILDSESFGVAIVEAMACEVPVIVTDVDGFKEVVDNGNAGLMVPRKKPQVMAENIYRLIQDTKLRKEIGRKQRDRVIKYYNWTENVKFMERIYERLVGNSEA
jgi:glycosyltransferase involved in cell wall biosynthesis